MISRNPTAFCLVVVVKRQNNSQILVYEINRAKTRHEKIAEAIVPYIIQSLQVNIID